MNDSKTTQKKKIKSPPKKAAAEKAPQSSQAGVARKRNVHSTPAGEDTPALMSRLWEQAAANNESLQELADRLDNISYPYLMALARGERPTEKMERKYLVSAAKYLNLPVGQVYLLAGVMSPEDFIFEPTKEEKMQHVLAAMRNDPLWAAYAPNEKVWQHADPSLKLLVCLLYERGARTSFFDGTETPEK